MAKNKDTLAAIMLLEQGEPSQEEAAEALQLLIDTGLIWSLQGSYQRMMFAFLDKGLVTVPANV